MILQVDTMQAIFRPAVVGEDWGLFQQVFVDFSFKKKTNCMTNLEPQQLAIISLF